MGKWKNAPVVYVIVQVRFSPILSLATYIPQIQEHFRKSDFPGFANRLNFQLGFALPNPGDPEQPTPPALPFERTNAYVFSNRQGTQSFVLEQNGLTFHVTDDYQDFKWLLDLYLKHLTVVNEIIKPNFSERVGLRYIDAVLPQPGATVSQYLVPEVLGVAQKLPSGSALQHTYTETIVQMDSISTVSRILIRDGQIAFPPDLQSLPVTISPRFTSYRGSHATIDTDSFQVAPFDMDILKLRDILTDLHQSVEHAFLGVTTPSAIADWK
jgi:uncharacterized protein (TIGR04255 family)